jgi:glycosyltransferase involved in cell wall biosynthesis
VITAIILTENEASEIAECIKSLFWVNEIFVLDSGSNDGTEKIAEKNGAKVFVNEFISFGQQRNFALDNLPISNEWILFMDADERSTVDFKNEIETSIANANDAIAGYYCCWKMMLDGKWLKRSDNFPKWQFRLLKKGRARFTDFGHGQKEYNVHGSIEYIKEPYLHFGFSKGWSHWLDRHNRYSSLEARERMNHQSFKNIFSKTPSKKIAALKFWLSRLPGWPVLRFFYSYILKFGFFEGSQGLIYCINIAYYEFLIQIKIREQLIKSKKPQS